MRRARPVGPAVLELDGRLELSGPAGRGFEIAGVGGRVEVRCDRLRSLRALGALCSGLVRLGPGTGRGIVGAVGAACPVVDVMVRGQRVGTLRRGRVIRVIRARGGLSRAFALIPAVRPVGVLRAMLLRGSPGVSQQSGT